MEEQAQLGVPGSELGHDSLLCPHDLEGTDVHDSLRVPGCCGPQVGEIHAHAFIRKLLDIFVTLSLRLLSSVI